MNFIEMTQVFYMLIRYFYKENYKGSLHMKNNIYHSYMQSTHSRGAKRGLIFIQEST